MTKLNFKIIKDTGNKYKIIQDHSHYPIGLDEGQMEGMAKWFKVSIMHDK
jgi:hypothetical protein